MLTIINEGTTAVTYYVVADSYSGCATFDLTVSAATAAYTDLGSFAAAVAIPPQTGGPLATGASFRYRITFTTAVLLDGQVVADAGDPDVTIYDSTDAEVASHAAGTSTETWVGDSLAAGTYTIEIYAYTAFTTYTMSLATAAP
jgi:hypothetical protein